MANRTFPLAGMALLIAVTLAAAGYWLMSEPAPAPEMPAAELTDPELLATHPDATAVISEDLHIESAPSGEPVEEAGDDPANGASPRQVRIDPSWKTDADRWRQIAESESQTELIDSQTALFMLQRAELASLLANSQMQQLMWANSGVEFTVVISGRVIDTYGHGIAGAEVEVSRTVARNAQGATGNTFVLDIVQGAATTRTDGAGIFSANFTLRAPKDAETIDVQVHARASGYFLEATVQLAKLRENEVRGGVTLKMAPAGSIAGRVIDQYGAAVAGARVSLNAVDRTSPSSRRARLAQTEENGSYTIDGVPPGDWHVSATNLRNANTRTRQPVNVAAGFQTAAPDLELNLTASVRVRLLADDGSPISKGKPDNRMAASIIYRLVDGRTVSNIATCNSRGDVTFHGAPADAVEFSFRVAGFEDSATFPLPARTVDVHDVGVVHMQRKSE